MFLLNIKDKGRKKIHLSVGLVVGGKRRRSRRRWKKLEDRAVDGGGNLKIKPMCGEINLKIDPMCSSVNLRIEPMCGGRKLKIEPMQW